MVTSQNLKTFQKRRSDGGSFGFPGIPDDVKNTKLIMAHRYSTFC